jgi:hypothetical protein
MSDRTPDETPLYPDDRPRATPAATPTRTKKSRTGLKLLGLLVLLPALLIAAWIAISLNWTYSKGERAGYIQKFSQKGWICKTWEGDIAVSTIPGSAPEHFLFTVRSDSVAGEISKLMGSRVTLHYNEHRGIPGSCFGETRYYVDGVKAVAGP